MSSENVREQLINGYMRTLKGLNGERIKDWASSEIENENRGALAAVVFYGACVRECMTRGVHDPVQAHWVALGALSLFEDEDFENVLYYMIGKPLPTKVADVVEYYKQNLQADAVNALNMLNNVKFEIGFNDDYNDFDFDEDADIDFDEDGNN
ncbi:MAG: hypothetical protein HZB19_00205 [Chloroflexi bacterium]|nr:hypothetical protein [Chloroflexota bacterium]